MVSASHDLCEKPIGLKAAKELNVKFGSAAKLLQIRMQIQGPIASVFKSMKNNSAKGLLVTCIAALLIKLLTVSAQAGSDFVIEAEDFNYGGGQYLSQADAMPYYGGAYNSLSAVANIDYANNDGNDSVVYRLGLSPNVVLTTSS